MTLTQKIIKEFDEKYYDKGTPSGLNQKEFRNFPELLKNSRLFLLSSLHQVATEAIEAVKLEKKEISYSQEERKVLEEIFGKYETPEYLRERIYGYNSAITEMEQKAKKFLENNYKLK